MFKSTFVSVVFLLLSSLLLGGCANQQLRTKSSVVDYLYPQSQEVNIQPGTPRITLPAKVGIAFVPSESKGYLNNLWVGSIRIEGLSEREKMALLDMVADHFKKYDFVKSIEVIPSSYLTPQGSFANLDQIKTMYDIDIIALVSYDQVQFVDEGMLSLTYWTIVGAYVVSGEKNDTNTLMDTTVYDIDSRKMLFRAPGVSRVKGAATPVNLTEELRADAGQGLREATEDMIRNLDLQLERFREKVKEKPEAYEFVDSSGRSWSGGGATGLLGLLLLAGLHSATGRRRAGRADERAAGEKTGA